MAIFKPVLKVSLISTLLLAASITTTAQANHNSHSVLPYVAIGVFATLLHQNSRRHHHTITRKYSHSTHCGHNGHNSSHYQHNQHSHSSGGYHHKQKRH